MSPSVILPLSLPDALPILVLGILVIAGAGNAVNLTDGLDGLAIVPVMIAAATFGLIAYLTGNANFARYLDRKSTRLNSSHMSTSYAVFCLKKKKNTAE